MYYTLRLHDLSFTRIQQQCDRAQRRLRLPCRCQRGRILHAQSAALPRNPANTAVVLAVALGSRIVEMQETQSSIIPGPRASMLAKVGCGDWVVVEYRMIQPDYVVFIAHGNPTVYLQHQMRRSPLQLQVVLALRLPRRSQPFYAQRLALTPLRVRLPVCLTELG